MLKVFRLQCVYMYMLLDMGCMVGEGVFTRVELPRYYNCDEICTSTVGCFWWWSSDLTGLS